MVEKKVCFISDATNGRADICPKANSPTHSGNQGGKSFYRQKEGAAYKNNIALTVIFRLVISDLTNTILIVLGTVNLQF